MSDVNRDPTIVSGLPAKMIDNVGASTSVAGAVSR
jgi:hypothetical protein